MATINELIEKYGYDEPIILNDVELNGVCETSIRQTFSRLAKLGKVKRYEQGVYYIPSEPSAVNKITAKKVYEKKYISNKESVYGFYTGLAFMHGIGLVDDNLDVIEIMTNKQKSRMRRIVKGDMHMIIRRSRAKITPNNIKTLQFLELVNSLDANKLPEEKKRKLFSYIEEQDIKKDDVVKYISKFPVKVARSLVETGVFSALS